MALELEHERGKLTGLGQSNAALREHNSVLETALAKREADLVQLNLQVRQHGGGTQPWGFPVVCAVVTAPAGNMPSLPIAEPRRAGVGGSCWARWSIPSQGRCPKGRHSPQWGLTADLVLASGSSASGDGEAGQFQQHPPWPPVALDLSTIREFIDFFFHFICSVLILTRGYFVYWFLERKERKRVGGWGRETVRETSM